MELISNICGVICIFCMFATPIAFAVWIFMIIRKSKARKIAKRFFLGTLAGIAISTIIGVSTSPSIRCEHEWESFEQVKPTCTESGIDVKYCTLCDTEKTSEGAPPTGHTWVETRKEATCTEQGELVKECSLCGIKTSEILIAQHNYIESVVSEPKCDSEGAVRHTCSLCGDVQNESIPAIGHSMTDATCTSPKTCSKCDKTDGEPLGHTTELGVCTRCEETIKKQSPITIIGMRWTKDYVGGIEWTFKIKNNTDKVIKYITFQWSCYNAVGDAIRDEIGWKNYVRVKYTGPLDPGKTTGTNRNTTLFYNHSYANMKWDEITVEYMDGTTESVTEYHYGYYKQ